MTRKLLTHVEFQNYPLTIGCDPEFFIVDKKTQKPVSPHDFVDGTKLKPTPLDGGAVQVDGLALEFNIEPATTATHFNRNTLSVMKQIRKMIPDHLEFHFTPTMWFDEDYLAKLPAHVLELGCDPDYDAYNNGYPNPKPKPLVKDGKVLRTAAGHLHFGWSDNIDVLSDDHRWNCITLSKRLDMVFGKITPWFDNDKLRAEMYGRPGCYRPKPYGMEYRTLSNAWAGHPLMYNYIYNVARWSFGTLLCSDIFRERTKNEIYDALGYRHDSIYSMSYSFQHNMGGYMPQIPISNNLPFNKGDDTKWR